MCYAFRVRFRSTYVALQRPYCALLTPAERATSLANPPQPWPEIEMGFSFVWMDVLATLGVLLNGMKDNTIHLRHKDVYYLRYHLHRVDNRRTSQTHTESLCGLIFGVIPLCTNCA